MENQEWTSMKSLKLCSPFPQSFCGKRDFIKKHKDELRIIKQGVRYHINVEDVNKLCKRLLAGK